MATGTRKNGATHLQPGWLTRLVLVTISYRKPIKTVSIIFNPLPIPADIAPLFGNIVAIGAGIVSFLLGLILALTRGFF